MDSHRIPIYEGFYIQIKNGRAVDPSGRQQESIRDVESWLSKYPNHSDFQTVATWLRLRQQEVQESEETYRARSRRAEFDARFDKTAQKSGLKDKILIELAREVARETNGVKPED